MDNSREFYDEIGEVDETLYNALLNRVRPTGAKIEVIATPAPSGFPWGKYLEMLDGEVERGR